MYDYNNYITYSHSHMNTSMDIITEDEMIARLKNIILEMHDEYIPIDNHESLTKIYNLYVNSTRFEPSNGIECVYMGTYCYFKQADFDGTIYFYEKGAAYGSVDAMYCAGKFYCDNTINQEKTIKYFGMAIGHGHTPSMNDLAMYYHEEKDHANAIKYFQMSISHGSKTSLNNYAMYNVEQRKYTEAKKYFIMAIDNGCNVAMLNYAFHCQHIDYNMEEALKYMHMALEHGNMGAFSILGEHYRHSRDYIKLIELCTSYHHMADRKDVIGSITYLGGSILNSIESEKFLMLLTVFEIKPNDKLTSSLELLIKTLKQKIDLIDLHFKYSIQGKGFEDAKTDFIIGLANEQNN